MNEGTPPRTLRFAEHPRPRASVVISAWKDAPHLPECLDALHRSQATTPYDVVVACNEPTSELLDWLDRNVSGAELMSFPVNRGFGGALNEGARHAGGELLVLLNDDAVVADGWLDALVASVDAEPGAGAVGSRVLAPDGAPREDGTVLWSDGSVTLVDDYYRADPPPPLGIRRVDYCSAVSLLVRASTWREVGGFDEGYYPAYYEDVDLCLKIGSLGQTVLYQPASVVRHQQGASSSSRYRVFLRDRNRHRLVARWGPVLARRPAPDPHNPRAIAAAIEMAAERHPAAGTPPLVPDEAPPEPGATREHYLRKELGVSHEYAALLEAELAWSEASALRPARKLIAQRLKSALRREPGLYRAAARLRRRP